MWPFTDEVPADDEVKTPPPPAGALTLLPPKVPAEKGAPPEPKAPPPKVAAPAPKVAPLPPSPPALNGPPPLPKPLPDDTDTPWRPPGLQSDV